MENKRKRKVNHDENSKETEISSECKVWFDNVDVDLIRASKQDGVGGGTLESAAFRAGTLYDEFASKEPTNEVALDCEFVGVGWEGRQNELARVSIVNRHGHVLLDKFVQPTNKVVDFRTQFSGIRKRDIILAQPKRANKKKNSKNHTNNNSQSEQSGNLDNSSQQQSRAPPKHAVLAALRTDPRPFFEVQLAVQQLIAGRILIGHAIRHDLDALRLTHPKQLVRDTSKYAEFRATTSGGGGGTPALRNLCSRFLHLGIQAGEHDSVQDARATMRLYNHVAARWEREIAQLGAANSKKKKMVNQQEQAQPITIKTPESAVSNVSNNRNSKMSGLSSKQRFLKKRSEARARIKRVLKNRRRN